MSDVLHDKIQSERDEALATLSDIVDHARYKSLGDGRIRDPERERIRLKYLRIVISAESERRKILEDKDLDELAAEVERLKEESDGERAGEIKV